MGKPDELVTKSVALYILSFYFFLGKRYLNEKQFSLPHVPFELLQGAFRKFAKSHNKRSGTGFLQMCHLTHTQCSLIVICV